MKEINRSETLPLTHAVFANLDIGVFFKESLNGVWHLKTSRSTAVCNYKGSQFKCRFADSEIVLAESNKSGWSVISSSVRSHSSCKEKRCIVIDRLSAEHQPSGWSQVRGLQIRRYLWILCGVCCSSLYCWITLMEKWTRICRDNVYRVELHCQPSLARINFRHGTSSSFQIQTTAALVLTWSP